jgi:hypothetical protein
MGPVRGRTPNALVCGNGGGVHDIQQFWRWPCIRWRHRPYRSGSASGAGFFQSAANPFTSSGNYQLSQIDLALSFLSGTNSATVTLNSDSSGLPGAVLATWNLSSLPVFGTCCTVETLTPSSTVFLSAGTQYWIVAAPGASNTWDAWNLNNTGATGLIAFDNGTGFFGVSGRTLSAFDVLGVPEPTTLALVSGGLALLLVRRRRAS